MKNKSLKYKVTNENEHASLLARVDELMRKGEKNVTEEESLEIREMGLALQAYEQGIYTVPLPDTLSDMIELRMYEMRLKQKDLAENLGVSTVKLSMILNGKQKPDIPFIKALHKKLLIPADFILEHI
ncbi:helix-turn-helix domain-containing protein [Dyadobacter bucti]|uniref:helix-turn-helix domain-containing protein n=1 Tax=Dyadobacter bucti TaxID=2572203 RepID=UPI0011099EBE|nr:helix-turn-helix domain-containing protein [Dyadobacter bucti]